MLLCSVISFAVYADYTAQCKKDSNSYVVASQSCSGGTITVKGYGDCKDCTVIVTTEFIGSESTYTYVCDVENGVGKVFNLGRNEYLSGVSNIVCPSGN